MVSKREVLTLVLLALVIAGCATMSQVRATNREGLIRLSLGMTKSQVLEAGSDE